MQKNYLKYVFITILAFNILTACNNQSEKSHTKETQNSEANSTIESSRENIFSAILNSDSLSTFKQMLQAAGLAQTLRKDGPFTVFAPTNKALEKLPDGIVEVLLKPESKERLAGLLKVHMTKGTYLFSDFKAQQSIKSLEGVELKVREKDGSTTISQAKIMVPSIKTKNGVIHIIDRFIVHMQPPISND